MDFDMEASADNVNAAAALWNSRGSFYSELFRTAGKMGRSDRLERARLRLLEDFDSDETASEAYGELAEEASEILRESSENSSSSIDVRAMKLLQKQLGVARGMAERGSYEVPVEINGRMTSINVRFVRGNGQESSVSITMSDADLGDIRADFFGTAGGMGGIIAAGDPDTGEFLKNNTDKLIERLTEAGTKTAGVKAAYSPRLDISALEDAKSTVRSASAELYRTAGIFVKFIAALAAER